MCRLFTVALIAAVFSISAFAQEYRNFIGSNGKIIEAAFLGFDEATQIVKLRLKDGREQNVKLDLFSAECQQRIKSGGQAGGQQGDDPFGGANVPQQEQEGDWEWLFDGQSLNGWEGDTNAWRVDQNERALVNTGRGNLFTTKQYDNFIIQLQFRCADRANNGLMLRVDDDAKSNVSRAMRVQIADDRNFNTGRDHNGSVYGTLSGSKPVTRHGDWNIMEVIVDGQKITTYVDGLKVVDDTLPQGGPFSNISKGRIGFMGLGGTTMLRHIHIRPLKTGEDWRTSRITANDSREGFTSIFDGRTLNGWQGDLDKFSAENNMLVYFGKPGGRLETIKEYRNFVMRFEFRLRPDANQSVRIRYNDGKALVINVRDDSNRPPDTFGWDYNGSIWAVHPARRGSLNAVGQWNTMEITANGSMIRVVVNDQIVTDTDIRNHRAQFAATGLHNKSGHIRFTSHSQHGQADVRNIRIKELP